MPRKSRSLSLAISLLVILILGCGVVVAAYFWGQGEKENLRLKRQDNQNKALVTLNKILEVETQYKAGKGCYANLPVLHEEGLVDEKLNRGIKEGYMFMVASDCNLFLVFAVPEKTQGDYRTGDYWYAMNTFGVVQAMPAQRPGPPTR